MKTSRKTNIFAKILCHQNIFTKVFTFFIYKNFIYIKTKEKVTRCFVMFASKFSRKLFSMQFSRICETKLFIRSFCLSITFDSISGPAYCQCFLSPPPPTVLPHISFSSQKSISRRFGDVHQVMIGRKCVVFQFMSMYFNQMSCKM